MSRPEPPSCATSRTGRWSCRITRSAKNQAGRRTGTSVMPIIRRPSLMRPVSHTASEATGPRIRHCAEEPVHMKREIDVILYDTKTPIVVAVGANGTRLCRTVRWRYFSWWEYLVFVDLKPLSKHEA